MITALPLAASGDSGGSFLVSPNLGLMIWTLLVFGFTMYVLSKVAFPRIQEALDKRANLIRDSIDEAEKTREEANTILEEYRARLKARSARSCWSPPAGTSRRRRGARSSAFARRSPTSPS